MKMGRKQIKQLKKCKWLRHIMLVEKNSCETKIKQLKKKRNQVNRSTWNGTRGNTAG